MPRRAGGPVLSVEPAPTTLTLRTALHGVRAPAAVGARSRAAARASPTAPSSAINRGKEGKQPAAIGPYQIRRELGRGAFGVVYQAVDAALDLALQQLLQMRAKEGSNLHKELTRRIKSIRKAISKIRKLQPHVAKRYRELLFERVKKIGVEISLDDDRLTKEVVFFAERSYFSEELTRLESHLEQFIETTNNQQAIGRMLEFISQEIGRELNTLGSKANDAEISRIVVHCKAELEKVREQVQNVE